MEKKGTKHISIRLKTAICINFLSHVCLILPLGEDQSDDNIVLEQWPPADDHCSISYLSHKSHMTPATQGRGACLASLGLRLG